MKLLRLVIGMVLLVALSSCHTPTREAKRMVARAKQLADTLPDSTASLIDSVLRMPVYFSERRRMDMALLQAEALFGDRGKEISPIMDDDFFDDNPNAISTSPELERAAQYYAKKKQYAKATHAALYSGFVQQHYNEKTAAMQSFMDAERYGEIAGDSLSVARAEYRMGKLLYDEGRKQESLSALKFAENYVGIRFVEKALIENSKAIVYILLSQNDSAEICLQKSLYYLNTGNSEKTKHKILNNFAVLYRREGKFDMAINYLRQIVEGHHFDDAEMFMYYLNIGKTFMAVGNLDSAAFYLQRIEKIIPSANVKNESKVSAYEALFSLVEIQNHDSVALRYHGMHGNLLYNVMRQRQEQNIYRVQKQYNYENLQNLLNRKIILRHRIILVISILLFLSAVIILFLRYRHKQLLKAEAEMKRQIEAMKKDLRRTVKFSVLDEEIALRLRMMITANRAAKRTGDPKKEWQPLVNQVMNGKENVFEAARSSI